MGVDQAGHEVLAGEVDDGGRGLGVGGEQGGTEEEEGASEGMWREMVEAGWCRHGAKVAPGGVTSSKGTYARIGS